jgi:hypothetical protein
MVSVKMPNLFNEEALENLLKQQRRLAWDADVSINWRYGVDFTKPFVPLDKNHILFPEVSDAEKLAISQYMGLMIAATISEMELTMQRLREVSWRPYMERNAVNPELIALGENFFDEEAKHARVFQKFLDLSAAELNVSPEDLKSILPRVNSGYVEKILRQNAKNDGLALWWIVTTVEEESILIFRMMKPHKAKLDPLYYELHHRHFEEEARHACYPFLMIELASALKTSPMTSWLRKTDFVVSEMLKLFWMFFELSKTLDISCFKNHHPFFRTLSGLIPKLKDRSLPGLLAAFVRETPYISTFINPLCYPHTKKAVAKSGVFHLPFPEPILNEVGW